MRGRNPPPQTIPRAREVPSGSAADSTLHGTPLPGQSAHPRHCRARRLRPAPRGGRRRAPEGARGRERRGRAPRRREATRRPVHARADGRGAGAQGALQPRPRRVPAGRQGHRGGEPRRAQRPQRTPSGRRDAPASREPREARKDPEAERHPHERPPEPDHGLLQGLAFDVGDPSKVLGGSIVHVWGTGVGTQVLDTTLEGNHVISSGLKARQVEGLVVRRVVARDFRDWGLIVDPNQASYTPTTPPLLEDVDAANVTWPTRRGSNGTSEACVWVGVKAVVHRLKARNCAWEGLWVGAGTRNSVFEDVDLNDTGIGIYVEHFATNSTFRRIHAGPNVDRGATCEWADPAWGGVPACTDDVFESSTFDTRVIGV